MVAYLIGCSKDEKLTETPPTFVLTLQASGNGNCEAIPSKTTYDRGEKVTIIATADSGNMFVDWLGSIIDTTNPLLIEMNSNLNITGRFQKIYIPNVSGKWSGVQYFINLTLSQPYNNASAFTGEAKAYLNTGDSIIYIVNGINTPPTIEMHWNKSGYYPVNYTGTWVNKNSFNGKIEENGVEYNLGFVKFQSIQEFSNRVPVSIGKKLE